MTNAKVNLDDLKISDEAATGDDYDPTADPGLDQAARAPGPEERAAELEQLDTRELLATAFKVSFDQVAAWRGEYWKLEGDQVETLANAWSPVLDAYVPDLARTPLGAAVLSTALIIGPRVMLDVAVRQEAKRRADPDASTRGEEGAEGGDRE